MLQTGGNKSVRVKEFHHCDENEVLLFGKKIACESFHFIIKNFCMHIMLIIFKQDLSMIIVIRGMEHRSNP